MVNRRNKGKKDRVLRSSFSQILTVDPSRGSSVVEDTAQEIPFNAEP